MISCLKRQAIFFIPACIWLSRFSESYVMSCLGCGLFFSGHFNCVIYKNGRWLKRDARFTNLRDSGRRTIFDLTDYKS